MGGAGKTQLALEYCRRMKDERRLGAIFWLDASSRNTLYSSIETAAKQLRPDRLFNNPDAAVALVNDILSSWSERWLLVFDNLDNPEDLPGIFSFFPASHCGSILITSRHAGSKELGQSIELDRMERKEGLQLLLGPSDVDPDELDAAKQILSLLGNLPLAIDQARAYISKRQLRLRAFVTEYERRKRSAMQETPRFWQYRRMLPSEEKETSLSLLTTWEMSLQFLGVGEQAAELEKVITLFAFFNPVNIGEQLFSNDADDGNLTNSPMSIFKGDGHWNHLKFEDAVVKMQELSLLQFSHCNENEITVSLHSLVSDWLRMRLDKDSQPIYLNTAVSHLKRYLASIGHSDHKTRQEGLAHLDTIWREAESLDLGDDLLEARLTFGIFYREQGRHKDAEMMYNYALVGYEKAWGPEHTLTLDTVHNLGILYADQGRHKDAEMMYNRALAGKEKAWGPEHTSTLNTANNLGNLYKNQGRHEDAEMMYNRALAGYEKAWGSEHTSMLNTVNNLGILYADQGRHKDAEMMYNRALAGKQKAWGPDHTSTLDTVHNLGLLYKNQGRYKDAEMMYNRALAGKEKAWGPEHTSTLDTVNNLGNLYINQGRHEDAEMMYNRALAGYEKAWGPEHMSMLNTVNNLGLLYTNQGRHRDAEMMYNCALAGKEKAWGPDHTSTLDTVHNLGLLYKNQGRHKDAEMMYNRALAGKEKAWGPEHTSTLNTVNNLGNLYINQGRHRDAEMMYNRALAGKEKAWGPEHMSTLDTVNNLGLLYADQGRYLDAELMYNRALAGKEKAWGPEHTSTLLTVNNLANLYESQGRHRDAEMMYDRALASKERTRASKLPDPSRK
jgi:tetratricopeptide (TPR) repeat protein